MTVSDSRAAELTSVALEASPRVDAAHAPLFAVGDRDVILRRLLAAADGVAILLALATALALGRRADIGGRLLWGLAAAPLMIVAFKVYGLYDRDMKRIGYSTVEDLPRIFHATIVGTLLLWLYSRSTPLHRLDFHEVLAFGVLAVALTMSARTAVRSSQWRLVGWEPTVLIGGGRLAELLTTKLTANPTYSANVIGALAERDALSAGNPSLPVLGSTDRLESVVRQHGVRRVIIASSHMHDQLQLEELLRRCRELNLKFSLLPTVSDTMGHIVEVDDVEGVTVLEVNPPWLPRSSRVLKRAMDLTMASALFVLFAPLMALVVIAIMLDSPGPPLFAQQRVGRNGRSFRLYKFRTMVLGAERLQDELMLESSDPNWVKLEHDPRITRVGGLLRRLSIDELPQLWNVMRGEMSMVGPRPLIPAEDERVTGWARGRLDLTPGLTGYWQVLGRTRIPFEEMVKLDYLYIMNWSLWGDVRLVLRTLPALVSGRGVN